MMEKREVLVLGLPHYIHREEGMPLAAELPTPLWRTVGVVGRLMLFTDGVDGEKRHGRGSSSYTGVR